MTGPTASNAPRPDATSLAATRTVAVVAVHGVADQRPGSSVRSIADLLLRLRDGGREVYRGFRELALRIPLRPVEPWAETAGLRAAAPASELSSAGGLNERPAYILDKLQPSAATDQRDDGAATLSGGPPAETPRPEPPPHHLFNLSSLRNYRGSRGTYDTVRLEGERRDGRPVHLYELHWADLSRVGHGLLAILGAFYQLALHLPHLGRLVVDHALFEHPDDAAWRRFATVHAWAVRVLTLFLPLMVLFQLLAVLGLLPGAAPGKEVLAIAGVTVALLVVAGRWRYHRPPAAGVATLRWLGFLGLAALVGASLGWALVGWRPGGGEPLLTPDQLLMLLWIALAGVVSFALVGVFDAYRPGARRWGHVLYVVTFLLPMLWITFAGEAGSHAGEASRVALATGVLHVFEVQLNATLGVAFTLYLMALASGLLGLLVVRRAARGKPRRRAGRVVWTALASLALATVLFYLATLLISAGAVYAGTPLLWQRTEEQTAEPPTYEPLPITRHFYESDPATNGAAPTHAEALVFLLRLGATSGIPILALGLGLVILVAAWGLAPEVWKEVRPPTGRRATEPRSSQSLGRWLDRAYAGLAWLLVALFVLTFLVAPALSVARILHVLFGLTLIPVDWLWQWNGVLLGTGGALVAASAVGLAFHGRLRNLALGFRPVLDIALDVDGYLRHLPADRTPRARMFERYASLLRHLGAWRDADGNGYAHIVLVAHSQGSVLTADLLDFLRREGDPELGWIDGPDRDGPRLRLFTMGSPLAQLYARNFPHLYGWISGEPAGWFPAGPDAGRPFRPHTEGAHHTGHELTGTRFPEPLELGLERWVNAYRSGDYVGRALWRSEETDGEVLWVARERGSEKPGIEHTVSEDAAGRRRELCLGSGAHTHYWDSTADAVAFELDLLVCS